MNVPQSPWPGIKPKCVVMCGGKGTRFGAGLEHKSMAPVEGMPLLGHVISHWRAFTDEFIFVVKHGKQSLIDYVATLPIDAAFVEPEELRGIADGLRYAQPLIDGPFIVVLGDCYCRGVFNFPPDFRSGVGVIAGAQEAQIQNNYSVEVTGNSIHALVEKPLRAPNDLCGTGFYFFQPDVFSYIQQVDDRCNSGELGITEVLIAMIEQGIDLQAVELNGVYVNANHAEDALRIAELLRDQDHVALTYQD